MSLHSIPRPGRWRITVALLAVVPAVLAYPWQSTRDYWLIGSATILVLVLLGWWRGLYFTTMLHRRLAMMRRRRFVAESSTDTRTTVLLRVRPLVTDRDVLPLPLLARYLNRYGVRTYAIRITSRAAASGEQETWIGLTVSAAANLAALQARSPRIPLHETAQVTARRLADHLREIGWDAGVVAPEDVPQLLATDSRETWRGMRRNDSDYLAAYQVSVDAALPETLDAIRSHPADETWTALEIAEAGRSAAAYTVAAACAFRTDTRPDGVAPLAGLILQRGSQWHSLSALEPTSTRRLDGHTDAPDDLLERVVWPTALPEAVSRT